MAALIPSANVEAAYEDMFKEITRKLYGEETGNGLHTLGTPVAQVATSGPTAPEGERSFTNLIDRSVAPTIEYEHNGGSTGNVGSGTGSNPTDTSATTTNAGNFKSDDQLSTAFGLAALMQTGFTAAGTIIGAQTIQKAVNPSTSNTNVGGTSNADTRWNGSIPATLPSGSEEVVQWPTSGKLGSYNGLHKASKTSKTRDQSHTEIYTTGVAATNSAPNGGNSTSSVVQHSQQHANITTSSSSSRKKSSAAAAAVTAANQQNVQLQIPKRYACTHCPYSTDRRDLYTRHENIHKDEKPFQCYACLKQFNRADHVKKHFLRMHREMVYDINKTRRNVSTTSSAQQQSHQIDQKPNIFLQQQLQVGAPVGVHGENFMTSQRQETSSSLSITQTIESVATASHAETMPIMKQEKISGDDVGNLGGAKVKREKRFTCCYCPWSGADKWGLKRHLNTHTKPFVCMLCDYKAARSERLATHVLKVHNKKACNKCSFLADNQDEYQAHMNDVHPHDNKPPRNNSTNNNLNVLRTIGNTLVSNAHLSNFQNPSTSFGGQSATSNNNNNSGNNSGGINTYTASDLNSTNNAMNNGNTGPLQEIMVNPTSMVGWRLSANGSLIPPHDLITGGLAVNANQKRGAERLFQYLEAEGSDPEDYARLLKMDALSRNTASVAQDFHKAGGVDLKDHHQFFNKPITSKQVALLQQQQKQKYRSHNRNLRSKQKNYSSSGHSSDEDKYDSVDLLSDQRKAMSAFLSRNFGLQEKVQANNNSSIKIKITPQNQRTTQSLLKHQKQNTKQQQQIKSPPAQPINLTNSNNHKQLKTHVKMKNNNNDNNCHKTLRTTLNNNTAYKGHRLDLIRDKENSNSIFSTIEYQNLSKFGTQFQNYVKDIINKYYAEPSLLFPIVPSQQSHYNVLQSELSAPSKRQRQSETEEYIEYLKNKEDITLTITPKTNNNTKRTCNNSKSSKIQNNNSCDSLRPAFILKRFRSSSAEEEEPKCQIIPLSYDRQISSDVDNSILESTPLLNHNLVPIDMSSNSSPSDSRRNIRKQSQPKKIKAPPEIIMTHMRDKYLKKMVDRKKSCAICTNNSRKSMLVFPYHTPASLLLHRIWKHTERSQKCYLCNKQFSKLYSLKVHYRLMHSI